MAKTIEQALDIMGGSGGDSVKLTKLSELLHSKEMIHAILDKNVATEPSQISTMPSLVAPKRILYDARAPGEWVTRAKMLQHRRERLEQVQNADTAKKNRKEIEHRLREQRVLEQLEASVREKHHPEQSKPEKELQKRRRKLQEESEKAHKKVVRGGPESAHETMKVCRRDRASQPISLGIDRNGGAVVRLPPRKSFNTVARMVMEVVELAMHGADYRRP